MTTSDKMWYRKYSPGDLVWLVGSDGWPDLPGTVVTRGKKGEVFVKTFFGGEERFIAVSEPGRLRKRDREGDLTMAGIKVK